jgi:raffinose/stachyose/melibiose transport system permease protein
VTRMATSTGTIGSAAAVNRRLSRALAYTVALLIAAIVIVPLVYVLVGGFRTTGQIAAKPVDLPHPWVTGNYTEILHSGSFWREVANSTFIAVITTVVVVAAGALAAFPLSRYLFRGREGLYTLFTLGLLFPVSVAVLPLYILLRQMGLLDHLIGVALPDAAFGLPVTIVILRPFMRAVPAELEDAAIIDGCSRFGFFWRVLLPLSRPALMTVSILAFVKSWNNFLLPLLVLTDEHGWTLPLGVANYSTQYSQDTARVLAFTALSMLPALCFFVLAERRIVGGLSGAVKG